MKKELTVYPNSFYFTYGALLGINGKNKMTMKQFIDSLFTITGIEVTEEIFNTVESQRLEFGNIANKIEEGERSTI